MLARRALATKRSSSSVKLTFRVGMAAVLSMHVDFETITAPLAKIANNNLYDMASEGDLREALLRVASYNDSQQQKVVSIAQ